MAEQRRVVTAEPENSETPLEASRAGSRRTACSSSAIISPCRPSICRRGGCASRAASGIRAEWTWDELLALPRAHRLRHRRVRRQRPLVPDRGQPASSGVPAPSAMPSGPAYRSGVVLERSGLEPDALEVLFEGADVGTESDHPEPMHFARSLPLAKALDPDTLLAFPHERRAARASPRLPAAAVRARLVRRRVGEVAAAHRGDRTGRSAATSSRSNTRSSARAERAWRRRSWDRWPQVGDHPPARGRRAGHRARNRLFGVAWAGEEAVSARRGQHRRRRRPGVAPT